MEHIYDLLSQQSGLEEIKPQMHLRDDLGFDSYRLVTLIIELEKILNIEFSLSDLDPQNITTVEALLNLCKRYKK